MSLSSLPILPQTTDAPSCCAPAAPAKGRLRLPRAAAWLLTAAAVAILAPLAAGLSPARLLEEALRTGRFVLKAYWGILPYFAASVAVSAWVTTSGLSSQVRAVFERREGLAIALAAGVGATVPLCSCGVIPLIAGLLASGVPLGPVMAFWISSPLMSPEKFILTAALLGPAYAAARLAAAVALGAGAGFLTWFLARRGWLADQVRPSLAGSACGCKGGAAAPAPPKGFLGEALGTTLFLGKWLTIAFFLEALIVLYVDPAWIGALLGGDNPWAIPLATAVGIPLYTSGVAAIPIAQGMLANGMSAGAAMAFLVAGPVTTVPAMVAVWALVRERTFSIYLGTSILGALAAGYLFQAVMG